MYGRLHITSEYNQHVQQWLFNGSSLKIKQDTIKKNVIQNYSVFLK